MLVLLCTLLIWRPATADGDVFNSGSNGSDGALDLHRPSPDPDPDGPYVVDFDPAAMGLDPDGDNIYHFTEITIAAGVTARISARTAGGPLFWLATGAVRIDGELDLRGEDGQDDTAVTNGQHRFPGQPGAGGFSGGIGGTTKSPPQSGSGPGGGIAGVRGGGGGGYANAGGNHGINQCTPTTPQGSGVEYGSALAIPLVGGSGGGGGLVLGSFPGGGGGAGGGALLIASSISVEIGGSIRADGGAGGDSSPPSGGFGGGGGSGGAIRIAAPLVTGNGSLSALGGAFGVGGFNNNCNAGLKRRQDGGAGSVGRIRIEAFLHQHNFATAATPAASLSAPFALFLPLGDPASVRVVSVGGIPITKPTAAFSPPDATIDSNQPVPVAIETRNIPPSATVNLLLVSDGQADQVVGPLPLTGASDPLTASVLVTLPTGFSRGFVRAKWSTQ